MVKVYRGWGALAVFGTQSYNVYTPPNQPQAQPRIENLIKPSRPRMKDTDNHTTSKAEKEPHWAEKEVKPREVAKESKPKESTKESKPKDKADKPEKSKDKDKNKDSGEAFTHEPGVIP